jgi:hypothetical protein
MVGTAALMYACAAGGGGETGAQAASSGAGAGGGSSASSGTGGEPDPLFDAGPKDDAASDAGLDPDAACAAVTQEATLTALPVDIVWLVDNSNSMDAAIAEVKQGLNNFASLIAASNLDYRVILLSKRGTAALSVCIPPPLSGDNACGNGPRFFHSSIDILSTQPLEQFLGTLAQTAGYMQGEAKGGEPWAAQLRPEATKTIVVVTDDNSRLSATDFETFPGGKNPFNTLTLPPGILDPSWGGMFDGYVFSGIYGWGSDQDPSVKCTYPDQTSPPSSGPTYTTLVTKTGGVRAKLCDGAAAWGPFFQAVAQAVLQTSKIECEVVIPEPSGQTIDFAQVNVALKSGNQETLIPNVGTAAGCGGTEGWYYDDPQLPTQVILCPASCDTAQTLAGPGKTGSVAVLFGCATIVK